MLGGCYYPIGVFTPVYPIIQKAFYMRHFQKAERPYWETLNYMMKFQLWEVHILKKGTMMIGGWGGTKEVAVLALPFLTNFLINSNFQILSK